LSVELSLGEVGDELVVGLDLVDSIYRLASRCASMSQATATALSQRHNGIDPVDHQTGTGYTIIAFLV
jgi:hypothetical protein